MTQADIDRIKNEEFLTAQRLKAEKEKAAEEAPMAEPKVETPSEPSADPDQGTSAQ